MNRRFQFDKSTQLFISPYNETLSVVAMRISNKEGSPAKIHACDPAPTPTGFAEVAAAFCMTSRRRLLFFRSTNGNKEPNSNAVPKLIQKRLRPVFPDLLASEFSKREAIGEGHDAVNYGSRTRDWARLAFRVPTVHQRTALKQVRTKTLGSDKVSLTYTVRS